MTIAIKFFFDHGKLPLALNQTIIALIPKIESPENPNHFRPISLCNTVYKAIAKLLVSRLAPVLQNHVSLYQNAFTPNRSIHENLLILQEILNTFRNSKSKIGWCALKLDMEKAYDRIEWDFLWAVLSKLGFPHKWTEWIKACVTTVSYSVKVNGETTNHFRPSRGLRQGDPLSPYLFIICMEVFISLMCQNSNENSTGIGFRLTPGTNKIPGLMFADDNLLFYKATNSTCTHLKKLSDDFCTLSGQLVFSKKIPHSKRNSLSGVFNMTKSESLGRYLGAHFSGYSPSKQDYKKIMQKK